MVPHDPNDMDAAIKVALARFVARVDSDRKSVATDRTLDPEVREEGIRRLDALRQSADSLRTALQSPSEAPGEPQ